MSDDKIKPLVGPAARIGRCPCGKGEVQIRLGGPGEDMLDAMIKLGACCRICGRSVKDFVMTTIGQEHLN